MPAGRSHCRLSDKSMPEPVVQWSLADIGFMSRALELARSGLGHTAPNPSVGCVLVQDGIIVGEGRTQAGGRPHGEAVALAMAGPKTSGAHAFVTLEPCAHESSRGPACSTALVELGIGGVTISVLDPDPRTRGLGVTRLESAGLVVRLGLLAEQGQQQIAGFEKRLRTGLPWVHVGKDDGTFDAVIDSLPTVDLATYLAEAGVKGLMRLCLTPESPAADQAAALNLVDSSD